MNDSVRTAEIQAHFERFTRSVETLSKEAGRAVGEVRLVAVSKNFPIEDVVSARGLGQRVFGENRVQELQAKVLEAEALGLDVVWHMIGHLQTNKVRQVVGRVALIHSVDRRRLLNAVEREANKKDLVQDVLLQVNVSGEETKGGFTPEETEAVIFERERFPHVRIRGLMTMAPFFDDPEDAAPVFHELRALRDRLSKKYDMPELQELSMGMTNDYPQAIREGATMLRVGSALFGSR